MNATGVQVRIFEEEKCIYERKIAESDENDLKTLLQNLREVQSGVNNFLTTLIQQRDVSGSAQNPTNRSISFDVESDPSEEEEEEDDDNNEEGETQVNPKRCKLST